MPKEKTFKDRILEYIYTISKQPVLLKDLLIANRQYKEGMHVDPARLEQQKMNQKTSEGKHHRVGCKTNCFPDRLDALQSPRK